MQSATHCEPQDVTCTMCATTPPGFFERYKGFLLSPGTLITTVNTLLMILGFVAGLANYYESGWVQPQVSHLIISDGMRLQANRWGSPLPPTGDKNKLYDNGSVAIYHRRPASPYQR